MPNFLIYKSSAGSGKTYTLVKEYLKIVLRNPDDFKHTLAVTFTNKAAGEMKARIMQKLGELAAGKDKALEKTLIDEGVDTDIPAQAKKVLDNVLHKYSYFSVLTIDSFFHRIIRSFAKELKIHLGYDIEIDDNKVLAKITDEVLAEIGIDAKLTSYLEKFAMKRIEESKDWKIEKEISRIGSEIFKERFFEKKLHLKNDISSSRELMSKFIDSIFAITRSFDEKMSSYANKANEIMAKYGLNILDFPHGKNGFMNYLLNKIKEGDYEPGKRVLEIVDNPSKWYSKNTSRKVKEAAENGLMELMNITVEHYNKNYKSYCTAKELEKTIYVTGIFKDLLEKLKEYRDENRLMLISDTNNVLQQVISGEESPFVYEKMGNNFKYFLIDEFQDTSVFQWRNLLPLVVNSLAENYFSIVVGDVKQSIYRWRNGNMRLLLEEIYHDLSNYKEVLQDKYLDENHRSKQEIVEFNNIFFEYAPKILANRFENNFNYIIGKAYSDVSQKNIHGRGGYVRINFIRRNPDDELSTNDKANQSLLETVDSVLKEGFTLKDILVLVRRNLEGSEAASLLMQNGCRVISNESLLLVNSAKVKLIINLLKYIVDRKNQLAKTEILYNITNLENNRKAQLDKIFSDHNERNDTLFEKLMPEEFFKTANTGKIDIDRINPELNNLTLYELTEKLIQIFKLNEIADAYLLRFQDAVLEYMGNENSDISGFVDWWEENKLKVSIIIPEHEDAVRVMTIHTAKGLESPVVIIPYSTWNRDIDSFKDLIWVSTDEPEPFNQSVCIVNAVSALNKTYFRQDYQEEMALTNLDNLNLIYVAFTRAIERLYVTVPEKRDPRYTAGKLIEDVIIADLNLNMKFNDADGVFEMGQPAKHAAEKEKDTIKSEQLDNYISNDWYQRIVVLPKHRSMNLFNYTQSDEKIRRGLLMHEVLSFVKTRDDIDTAISLSQSKGILTESERESIKKDIEHLTNLEEIKDWFSGKWEVKTEADILLPDGKTIRPDRVMIKDDKIILADYKTGKKIEGHKTQLNKYTDILKQAGYNSIDKYIIYLDEMEIAKV
jgi:ATP-dependent exoDNAse (exonuclease V) beta subunit